MVEVIAVLSELVSRQACVSTLFPALPSRGHLASLAYLPEKCHFWSQGPRDVQLSRQQEAS